MAKDSPHYPLTPEEVEEATTAFKEFDKDSNGSITAQEMRECLNRTHIDHDNDEVDSAMKSMDSNKDGKVTFDEYMSFMVKMVTEQSHKNERKHSSKQQTKKK
ncbi:unnamed protein product [Adineta steineri]|uniref:EF-hand domain-containing protein n=1 Tax=Adineta steineri TaxID=433720 RepID=A0A819RE05_9BILA|nr:unnamed protein product [Adineta steineri]